MVNPNRQPEHNEPIRLGEVFDEVMRTIDPPSPDETKTPEEEFNAALVSFNQLHLRQEDGDPVSPDDVAAAWERLDAARRNVSNPPAE